nr:hypothetical protein CPGR_04058 [Mycolicibacter nonchromogenicus]
MLLGFKLQGATGQGDGDVQPALDDIRGQTAVAVTDGEQHSAGRVLLRHIHFGKDVSAAGKHRQCLIEHRAGLRIQRHFEPDRILRRCSGGQPRDQRVEQRQNVVGFSLLRPLLFQLLDHLGMLVCEVVELREVLIEPEQRPPIGLEVSASGEQLVLVHDTDRNMIGGGLPAVGEDRP